MTRNTLEKRLNELRSDKKEVDDIRFKIIAEIKAIHIKLLNVDEVKIGRASCRERV